MSTECNVDSSFKPALLLMSGRAVAFAGTFFIPVVLVRIFDQEQFGSYKQLFLIYSTFYFIAQFGMSHSLFYFLCLRPDKGGRYVMNSVLFLAAAGLVCLALLELKAPTISQWLSNGALTGYMTPVAVFLLLMMTSSVLEIVMICRKRHRWASLSYALSDIARAGFFIIPVLLLRRLEWLLFGAVAFGLLRLSVTLFYLVVEYRQELRPDVQQLKSQLVYALPFGLAVLIDILQSNFHHYAVSYSFDAATFAIYSVGCLQIPLVDFVATPAGDVMMVRMGEKIRDGRNEAVLPIWHDTTRKLALVFFPLVTLLLIAARELIVVLFTESYLASVPIFMIWSLSILLAVVLADGILRVYAQTRFLVALNTVRLMLIVALTPLLISRFQVLGAVLAAILTGLVAKGLALARIKRLTGLPVSQVLPWSSLGTIGALSVVAALPALLVKLSLTISAPALLLMTVTVYSLSYLSLVFSFDVLTDNERGAITGWVQRLTARAIKVAELR